MRGSGILCYRNTRCSLGGSSREPQEHSLPSVCPSVPTTAAAPSTGVTPAPRAGGNTTAHLTSGFRSFPFLVASKHSILCQWSSFHILWVIFRWGMWGLFYCTPQERWGELQKLFETAPSSTTGPAKLLGSPGVLEKQDSVQTPQEWGAQAGRGRILGGFSARRSSKN